MGHKTVPALPALSLAAVALLGPAPAPRVNPAGIFDVVVQHSEQSLHVVVGGGELHLVDILLPNPHEARVHLAPRAVLKSVGGTALLFLSVEPEF